jgi:large subunit ribosomal protein L14
VGAKRAVAGKPAYSRRHVNTGLQVMSRARVADNSGAKGSCNYRRTRV